MIITDNFLIGYQYTSSALIGQVMSDDTIAAGLEPSSTKTTPSDTTTVSDFTDSAMIKMSKLIATAISDFDKNTLQVRHKNIEDKINENSASLTDVYSQISDLKSRLAIVENENNSLKKKITESETNHKVHVAKTETNRKCDEKLHNHYLFQLSMREQRQKLHSIKVVNFQRPSHNGPIDDVLIYKLLIRPVLLQELEKGNLSYVPDNMNSIIEFSHPLGVTKNGELPSYVFRFYSRVLMYSFMYNHYEKLKELSDQAKALPVSATFADAAKFVPNKPMRVSYLLSTLNGQVMYSLYRHPLVLKCKLRKLNVAFMLKNTNKWIDIRNPFASDLLAMTLPMSPIPEILREARGTNPLIYEEEPFDDVTLEDFGVETNLPANKTVTTAAKTTTTRPAAPSSVVTRAAATLLTEEADINEAANALADAIMEAQTNRQEKRPAVQSPPEKPGAKKTNHQQSPHNNRRGRGRGRR